MDNNILDNQTPNSFLANLNLGSRLLTRVNQQYLANSGDLNLLNHYFEGLIWTVLLRINF